MPWRCSDALNSLLRKGYTRCQRLAIIQQPDPKGFTSDAFTKALRDGARKLTDQEIHVEWAARLVRHDHLPERQVMTGRHPAPARVPRVRDLGGKTTFTSSVLPRYLRKEKPSEDLLPGLYFKSVCTGVFTKAPGHRLTRQRENNAPC